MSIDELIYKIETSHAEVLFIKYTLAWFEMEYPYFSILFIIACRDRAWKKGPLVIIALLSVAVLDSLQDGADHFTQLYPVRVFTLKEQTRLDKILVSFTGPVIASKLFGQMKQGE
jgi:hypothetical protein